ncbi:MAG: hypothetical protein SH850_29790 [Planctomycetaceae bacterium]|nr:hypothetical protein [Planctomycetaceae bacterium]
MAVLTVFGRLGMTQHEWLLAVQVEIGPPQASQFCRSQAGLNGQFVHQGPFAAGQAVSDGLVSSDHLHPLPFFRHQRSPNPATIRFRSADPN